ncbi:MAG: hypothetical protein QGG04_00965 [Candidatus Marinimicrobia bacterium]|nr:hypothetical protein [Candidatus Neomarinimicrobiota bacterium]
MIYALLRRRIWLWQNRLILSLVFLLAIPIILTAMIVLPFKNIFVNSLTDMPFEQWVAPGLIFIISSIALVPFLYREFFSLRIHRKMLVHVSMAPYTKQKIILGYLTVAVLEALLIGLVSLVILSVLIPVHLSASELLMLTIQLIIYLCILGNLIITIALAIDAVTPFLLISFYLIILVIFGNGFIVEFGFFPIAVESILKLQPLSLPYQSLQIFITSRVMEWSKFGISLLLSGIWITGNSFLLQKKLRQ